jgi:hypothetical protein
MFVTSTTIPSGVGVAQMHSFCAISASSAGLPNASNFKALISTTTNSAASILPDVGSFILVGSKAVIANDKADLLDGTIAIPISRSQTGAPQNASPVWTGSQTNGALSSNCNDWTSNMAVSTGVTGASSITNSSWINAFSQSCNFTANLYCFGP